MTKHAKRLAAVAPANPSTATGSRFMRIEEVMRQTALPRSTIYDKAKKGQFPKPIRLTPRISAWEAVAVLAWVQSRIEESALSRSDAA